ncbi:phosphotransferase [Paenibacillus sp. HGF5]|uniref:phosphotransferase n=1 Tax=Paenibacillus sp. HGF5 TaxID=908341 RepID=UPI0002071A89|nr:phosphotransferase [Paenibacillus sp. HGF5]EGG33986.1 conserved domain protein [Paenibacillus sp. HGF5]
MEVARTINLIEEEIINDLKGKFGWHIQSLEANNLGYGNMKWIMKTDSESYFVKKYCKVRYRRGLEDVHEALRYQDLMYRDGIPCQPVYAYNNRYIHRLQSDEDYMITGVSKGELIQAGTANLQQMYSLGETTGRMHKWMSIHMPRRTVLHWDLPSKHKMIARLELNLHETEEANHGKYVLAIQKQMEILSGVDMDIFNECAKGWAHWDMHVDNLLFYKDGVADIVDFDRVQFVYPDFDISRALLSCALKDDQMRLDAVEAYVEGYRVHMSLSNEQLVRSIKLTWYKEFKWVHAMYCSEKTMGRFIDEMIWIGDNWNELNDIFKL